MNTNYAYYKYFEYKAIISHSSHNCNIHITAVLFAAFPPRRPWFEPVSSHVGSAVDRAALRQIFTVCHSRAGAIGQ